MRFPPRLLRSAPNGAKLFEIEPPIGAGFGAFYKVTGPHSPADLYLGQSKQDAERVYGEASKG